MSVFSECPPVIIMQHDKPFKFYSRYLIPEVLIFGDSNNLFRDC